MGGRGANSGMPVIYPSGEGEKDDSRMDLKPSAPETLEKALGKKGRPMSTREAVMKANLFYDKITGTKEYNNNCQRAVIATEARFRGYDVIAQPTYDGGTMSYSGNWANNFSGAKVARVDNLSSQRTQKKQ